jgi:3,4-dihydroxy 2-butanone 4-phosphate synthase/GTP cyclohydrolase II
MDTVASAMSEFALGRPVIVVDDVTRKNEGCLVVAADLVTPESMAFLVRHSSGFVGVAMTERDANRLWLPPMKVTSNPHFDTASAVSVDAAAGITTGISAADRARTARVLADPDSVVDDLLRPGHMMPLRARRGGVLERPGHTEAAVELAQLAGRAPAAVMATVVSEVRPTEMARRVELAAFAARHEFAMIDVASLREFMLRESMTFDVAAN